VTWSAETHGGLSRDADFSLNIYFPTDREIITMLTSIMTSPNAAAGTAASMESDFYVPRSSAVSSGVPAISNRTVTNVQVALSSLVVSLPSPWITGSHSASESRLLVKKWVWENCQDEIFKALKVTMMVSDERSEGSTSSTSSPSSPSQATAVTISSVPTSYTNGNQTSLDLSGEASAAVAGSLSSVDVDGDISVKELLEKDCCRRCSMTMLRLQEELTARNKQLEMINSELASANEIVLQASGEQLQHFACMSHEIRTPLNCIVGVASLMLDELNGSKQAAAASGEIEGEISTGSTSGKLRKSPPFSTPFEESLRMIINSSELLGNVVNDVLDHSKFESGRIELEIRRANLQETLDAVLAPLNTRLTQDPRNIHIRCYYDQGVPEYIHTDPRRLQQILLNLLGNAIKFSKEGGRIELHISLLNNSAETGIPYSDDDISAMINDEDRATSFGDMSAPIAEICLCERGNVMTPARLMRQAVAKSRRILPGGSTPDDFIDEANDEYSMLPPRSINGKFLQIDVVDYGKGIHRRDFQRIFQPFLHASDHDANEHGGTGLGLPITGKIIESMGGLICVDSKVNEWTKFHVELPCHDAIPPDDRVLVSSKMKDSTILFVFKDAFFPGTTAHFQLSCSLYGASLQCYESMSELDSYLDRSIGIDNGESRNLLDVNRSYVLVVLGFMYDEAVFQRLRRFVQRRLSLVTFGPGKDNHVECEDGHFQCPNSRLPTVLMRYLSGFAGPLLEEGSDMMDSATKQEPVSEAEPGNANYEGLPTKNLRVLVAEDNLVNQKVITRMLNRLGVVSISVAGNGQDAVQLEATDEFDIVLLDMQMPIMDGLTACRLIKERHQLNLSTPPKIAFVTANVGQSFLSRTREAGSDGFLSKPYTLTGVQVCLSSLFS
jgi:signal transduction histidine kinase